MNFKPKFILISPGPGLAYPTCLSEPPPVHIFDRLRTSESEAYANHLNDENGKLLRGLDSDDHDPSSHGVGGMTGSIHDPSSLAARLADEDEAILTPDEIPLPKNWELRKTQSCLGSGKGRANGEKGNEKGTATSRVFFGDYKSRRTTWQDPRFLPPHWEQRIDKETRKVKEVY